jgi:predicted GIY-YIG superfamily endonuclease
MINTGTIYLIIFPNKKYYVGQTGRCIKKRISEHLISKYPVGCALRKYENDNCIIKILKQGNFNNKQLDILEQKFIKKYKSNNRNFGYNLTPGGNSKKVNKTMIKFKKMIQSHFNQFLED